MNNQAVFFFSYLGVFNAFILSVYFFFFTSRKTISSYLLGALLLVISIRVGKSVAYFFDYQLSRTYLQIGLTACFFIGPFLYFYIQSETKQTRKMPKAWLWQLTLWATIAAVAGMIYPYQYFPKIWGQTFIPAIYLQWGAYVAFSLLSLIPTVKKIARKESVQPFEKWVIVICLAVAILWACYIYSYLDITRGSYISGALWFSLIIYGVIFVLLYRKKASDLFSASTRKYAVKKLDPSEAELIIGRLKNIMTEKELFKNPNLKVSDLAKAINVPGHQLSQVLNDNIRKNFTLFVNEYRIAEACQILSQPTNLTIEAVGDEVGFNSKSTFFATFKKIKGTTPSAFQQSITPDL